MNIEDILNTYRTALQRIASGISSCIDGTISLDREDMQAIARTAIDKVAGLEFDEDQKQSNAELSGGEAVRSDALLGELRNLERLVREYVEKAPCTCNHPVKGVTCWPCIFRHNLNHISPNRN